MESIYLAPVDLLSIGCTAALIAFFAIDVLIEQHPINSSARLFQHYHNYLGSFIAYFVLRQIIQLIWSDTEMYAHPLFQLLNEPILIGLYLLYIRFARYATGIMPKKNSLVFQWMKNTYWICFSYVLFHLVRILGEFDIDTYQPTAYLIRLLLGIVIFRIMLQPMPPNLYTKYVRRGTWLFLASIGIYYLIPLIRGCIPPSIHIPAPIKGLDWLIFGTLANVMFFWAAVRLRLRETLIESEIQKKVMENQLLESELKKNEVENQLLESELKKNEVENQLLESELKHKETDKQLLESKLKYSELENRLLEDKFSMIRSLHDDIAPAVSHIRNVANVQLEFPDPMECPNDLQDIEVTAETSLDDLNFLVKLLKTDTEKATQLVQKDFGWMQYLKELGEKRLKVCKIKLDFQAAETVTELSTQFHIRAVERIRRIYTIAIHNICKHSQANQVVVHFQHFAPFLHYTIADNGIGMVPEDELNGNGIRHIRKHTADLEGHFELQSIENQGTTLVFKFPINTLCGEPT